MNERGDSVSGGTHSLRRLRAAEALWTRHQGSTVPGLISARRRTTITPRASKHRGVSVATNRAGKPNTRNHPAMISRMKSSNSPNAACSKRVIRSSKRSRSIGFICRLSSNR